MVIRPQHVRDVLFCFKGTRTFFAKYNLDYSDFLKNGIDEQKLLDLNDSMANKVVRAAHGRK